jgi:hypothetical protein
MPYFGKSKGRHDSEIVIEREKRERAWQDDVGRPSGEKAKKTKDINLLKRAACKEGICHISTKLLNGEGAKMRLSIDTNKDSAKRIMEDVLGQEGAEAMWMEFKKGIQTINPAIFHSFIGGGFTKYFWVYFKYSPVSETETPVKLVQLPDPSTGKLSAEKPFPTAGLFNEESKEFYPLKLYTEYLFKVLYKGYNTRVPGKNLLWLQCNYLFADERKATGNLHEGAQHSDFDTEGRKHSWDLLGHPATNILCIHGQTPLAFTSVRKNTQHSKKLRKETVHVLSPGDAAMIGWRQFHATKLPDTEITVPNCRVQAMFSSSPADLNDGKTKEDTVHLHLNQDNLDRYELMRREIMRKEELSF